ncbi:O-succinylbenzoic acid--CoA ligase [Saonia flava]|uniref:O-succinylbenzoic acid--CoA ligase n=1 Tax=Saonia flava TaxID=523696 RepID=A0A846QVQ7_9FLAO|nr:AMP-binding protein [Saonia flava]NJB69655.1 O-succinylbenzoic acid--CoA ligase [Saonia flava]
MMSNYNHIHPSFKLNGISCSKKELGQVACGLIKEGMPYEVSIGYFLLDWLSSKSTINVKTSGSTGIPKTIVLKKEHMVNSALATGNFFNIQSGSLALLCLHTDFIAGKMMLVRAMALGLELDYVEPSANPLLYCSKKYEFAAMVPLQVEGSLQKLNQIRTLIVGGAPLSYSLEEELSTIKSKVYETYGMTETITHIAVRKVSSASSRVNNYFNILPGITISKDNRDCLIISAPKISDSNIVTNDVVRLHSNSTFEWLGRFDNVINSGGIKFIPEEIESKLASIITNRLFVAGIPDEKLGQKLILVVEGNESSTKIIEKIKNSNSLSKFEIPKEVFMVEKIIETSNGKIDRHRTLEQLVDNK